MTDESYQTSIQIIGVVALILLILVGFPWLAMLVWNYKVVPEALTTGVFLPKVSFWFVFWLGFAWRLACGSYNSGWRKSS